MPRTARSLKLSPNGKQQVERALTDKAWGIEELVKKTDIGEATAKNFRSGKPVDRKNFVGLCKALGLAWETVADLPEGIPEVGASEDKPFQSPQSSEEEEFEQFVAEVRSHCCDTILARHREMQLFNLKKIPVNQLFVDVYVLEELASQRFATMQDFPEVLNEQKGELWQKLERVWLGGRKQRSDGMEIAAKCRRLMILGKPGAGKTTFMKHLAVACCEGQFHPGLIPVLIELQAVDTRQFDLLRLIQRAFDCDEATTGRLLKAGKGLILLDGLDEVPQQWRERVQQQISGFSDQVDCYYNNHVIVTCRTQTAEYRIKDFEYVEVADFNREQKQAFIRNWFSAAEKDPDGWLARNLKANQSRNRDGSQTLLKQIESNPRLEELAGTPVLLSLICWVYTDRGELPQARSALYTQGLRLLLQQWDENRNIKSEHRFGQQRYCSLSLEDKEALLAEVAQRKFQQPDNFVLFSEAELSSNIATLPGCASAEATGVLRAIEAHHGLLIERAQTLWSFSHLTFQEYFVAQWFVQRQNWQGLAKQVWNPRWREVFVLAIEMAQPSDDLLWAIKQEIDQSIATEQFLQDLLIRLNHKSTCISVSNDNALVRAFYCALSVNDIESLSPKYNLDEVNSSLHINFYNLKDTSEDYLIDYTSWSLLYHAYCIVIDSYSGIYTYQHIIDLFIKDYAILMNCPISPDYKNALERIKDLSPAFLQSKQLTAKNLSAFTGWISESGRAWAENLREVIIRHRNIRHSLNQHQYDLFNRYYEANKFLYELIQEPGVASFDVHQENEDNLFLPIAVLKQRLPHFYS